MKTKEIYDGFILGGLFGLSFVIAISIPNVGPFESYGFMRFLIQSFVGISIGGIIGIAFVLIKSKLW